MVFERATDLVCIPPPSSGSEVAAFPGFYCSVVGEGYCGAGKRRRGIDRLTSDRSGILGMHT